MSRIDSAFIARKVAAAFVALDHRASTVRTEHRFELEARRPDRFYVREYTWVSEEGTEKAPEVHSGKEKNGARSHRLHGPVLVGPESERIAVIDLGRVLQEGDVETVELEHFFVCTKPRNPGFVGQVATDGCEQIILRAILPGGAGRRVSFRSFKSGASESYLDEPLEPHEVGPLLTPLERVGDWSEYSREIADPKPGDRYRITWDI